MNIPFPQTLITPLSSIIIAGLCLSGGHALGNCTFTDLSNGAFAQPALRQGWLEAADAIGGAGTSATVTINCTTGGQISNATIDHVSSPNGFNAANPNSRAIIRHFNSGKVLNTGGSFNPGTTDWSQPSTADFNLPIDADAALDISLTIGFADNRVLSAGLYQYRVTLTATPN